MNQEQFEIIMAKLNEISMAILLLSRVEIKYDYCNGHTTLGSICNCHLYCRGERTGGWVCPVHGQCF